MRDSDPVHPPSGTMLPCLQTAKIAPGSTLTTPNRPPMVYSWLPRARAHTVRQLGAMGAGPTCIIFAWGRCGTLVAFLLPMQSSRRLTSAPQAKVMQVGPAPMAPNCRTVCAWARGSQEHTMGGRLRAVRVDPGAISAVSRHGSIVPEGRCTGWLSRIGIVM